MRIAGPLVFVCTLLVAAQPAGCGGSSSNETTHPRTPQSSGRASASTAPPGASAQACDTHAVEVSALRATGVACGQARRVMLDWQRSGNCSAAAGASRNSCTVRGYRCLGAMTDRGIAVGCAREDRSIAFVAKRG
ncbi:MAG TPA: hypothetical protein VII45_00715 [Solirubrobacterales bacterium]